MEDASDSPQITRSEAAFGQRVVAARKRQVNRFSRFPAFNAACSERTLALSGTTASAWKGLVIDSIERPAPDGSFRNPFKNPPVVLLS
jgi:predicted ATPase with chaperone activity